jgi:hypothetical protein
MNHRELSFIIFLSNLKSKLYSEIRLDRWTAAAQNVQNELARICGQTKNARRGKPLSGANGQSHIIEFCSCVCCCAKGIQQRYVWAW